MKYKSYTTMEPVFELVFENPNFEATFEPEGKFLIMSRRCLWIKVGKKDEMCGKPCKGKFCYAHSKLVENGATIPISCFGCNVGITRSRYLCAHCEKYSGL